MKTHLQPLKPSNWQNHTAASRLWVIDWTEKYKNKKLVPQGHGGCCAYRDSVRLTNGEPADAVIVDLDSPMDMTSLGFKPNVWGKPNIRQCDAVLYPTNDLLYDAVLFIETKYSENETEFNSYRQDALKQITDTVEQLKLRGCPLSERNLFGLISLPMLPVGGAMAFSPIEMGQIFQEHDISIMVSNHVAFTDAQTVREVHSV